jgi:fucose permease
VLADYVISSYYLIKSLFVILGIITISTDALILVHIQSERTYRQDTR